MEVTREQLIQFYRQRLLWQMEHGLPIAKVAETLERLLQSPNAEPQVGVEQKGSEGLGGTDWI
jgi:hypothetical protein